MKRSNVRSRFRLCLLLTVACGSFLEAFVASAADSSPTNAAPYLAAVRQFADQVLAHGRDVYGKPTPLFVDGLNVDTREPVKWKWADGKEWVLCNLANQQGLFRTGAFLGICARIPAVGRSVSLGNGAEHRPRQWLG